MRVANAIVMIKAECDAKKAEEALEQAKGRVREAISIAKQ